MGQYALQLSQWQAERMITFGVILFLYLFIGWVVAYEAHKRDWNSRLARWDRASHMVWWLMWWFKGAPILNQTYSGWASRFGDWSNAILSRLFNRMVEFNWRKNGTKDES